MYSCFLLDLLKSCLLFFQDMTVAQLQAFTDTQAASVTSAQRAAMTTAQTAILDEVSTGGQTEQPEVTAAPPSTGKKSITNKTGHNRFKAKYVSMETETPRSACMFTQ